MSDPTRLSASRLLPRLQRREIGPVELTRACLSRIEASDGALGAFLRTNPHAEREAAAVESRLGRGEWLPLAGIPVAIKDNLATAGLETTCASRILGGFVPLRDATADARLKEAGSVILG